MSSSFSSRQWSEIRKEFGIHCVRHRDFKKAKKYFEESLNFDAEKLDSVFLLTNTQAKEANTEDALELLNQISVTQEGLCFEFLMLERFYPTTCTMQTFHILTGTFDLINVTCTNQQRTSRNISTVICRSAIPTMSKICLKRVYCWQ